jgi:hypothetical protein
LNSLVVAGWAGSSRKSAWTGRNTTLHHGVNVVPRNVEEAARAAGIGARTLLRWMQLPDFQKAYREARRAAFGQAIARLRPGTSAAATTLLKTMIDPDTPASVRVRAAEAIFNHAAKAIEIEDIEARVAELERASALAGTGGRLK